jgi:hypothetical protein
MLEISKGAEVCMNLRSAGVTGNLSPPKIWPPRAKFPRKFAPPGPYEIWPPSTLLLLFPPRKYGPLFGNLAPSKKL